MVLFTESVLRRRQEIWGFSFLVIEKWNSLCDVPWLLSCRFNQLNQHGIGSSLEIVHNPPDRSFGTFNGILSRGDMSASVSNIGCTNTANCLVGWDFRASCHLCWSFAFHLHQNLCPLPSNLPVLDITPLMIVNHFHLMSYRKTVHTAWSLTIHKYSNFQALHHYFTCFAG